MTENNAKLEVRNRMSAYAMMDSQQANLEFIPNPQKDNKLFFGCGNITGYISPNVLKGYNELQVNIVKAKGNQELINSLMDDFVEGLQYAECRKPDSDVWVSCLMIKGNNKPEITFKRRSN